MTQSQAEGLAKLEKAIRLSMEMAATADHLDVLTAVNVVSRSMRRECISYDAAIIACAALAVRLQRVSNPAPAPSPE